ncbi:MAG: prepilin-type N-terminal cleavage/methylation domain-containing protein [bacterium]
MSQNIQKNRGFSLVEMMVAMTILGVAMSIGIAGWAHVLIGEKRVEAQNDLDMDVRASVERLRADIRVSDLNKILFWPAGVGPYTAISFPVAVASSSTNLLNQGGTNIAWNRTMIYHVFVSSPNQLKRTVFYNRDPDASISNRQVQLDRVVADGNGNNACLNGETTSTSLLFANLFEWQLFPRTAQFDCYAATTMRDRFLFGSTVVAGGPHTVEFKVIGKNPAGNANKYLGIDVLNCSVSGSDQEAEAHRSATIGGSFLVSTNYIPSGSWSGNYQLRPHCSTNGQGVSITVFNDCWEESNFETPGAVAENMSREFDTTLKTNNIFPYNHYVMRLTGATGFVWRAGGDNSLMSDPSSQNNDSSPDNLQNTPLNVCARVLIRGEYIRQTGYGPVLLFTKSTPNPVLTDPTFAVAASSNSCNAMPGTVQALKFYQYGVEKSWSACANDTVYGVPAAPITVYSNQSYLVSYYLLDVGGACNMYHNEDPRYHIGSYMLTNVATTATYDENWSGNPYYTTDRNLLGGDGRTYSLFKIFSAFASNATYTSAIFDSGQSAAAAKTVSWSNSVPANSWFQLFARTGDAADMSDAPAWSTLSPIASAGTFANNTGRYIQFLVKMGNTPFTATTPFPPTPRLLWVAFNWTGETKYIDVAGILSKGTDYAQCEVTLDGQPLTKALKIDLTIYKDVRRISGGTERFTSFITAEVSPRNTGM